MIYDPHTGKIDTDYLIAELERTRVQRDALAEAAKYTIATMGKFGGNTEAISDLHHCLYFLRKALAALEMNE